MVARAGNLIVGASTIVENLIDWPSAQGTEAPVSFISKHYKMSGLDSITGVIIWTVTGQPDLSGTYAPKTGTVNPIWISGVWSGV
jgi:hypothetical protein